jgi:hypothetical protein
MPIKIFLKRKLNETKGVVLQLKMKAENIFQANQTLSFSENWFMTVYNFGLDLSDVGCLKNGVGLLKMEAL